MPEGDTIFRAARTLQRALAGRIVTGFETVLPKLARVNEDAPLAGRIVERVEARGKWMLMHFSGDLILLTHMLMSGSWHIYRPGETWKRSHQDMRIVIETGEFVAVAFRVPVAEFHTSTSLNKHPSLLRLGPDVLASEDFVPQALANLRQNPQLGLGEALLRQSLIAGPGNVFKSEICFACGLDPFRLVGSLSADELQKVATVAVQMMKSNTTDSSGDKIVTYRGLRRTTGRSDPYARLWVYGRAGEPCRKCGYVIQVRRQGTDARKTYFCPSCQT
jgi:endonuclease-8